MLNRLFTLLLLLVLGSHLYAAKNDSIALVPPIERSTYPLSPAQVVVPSSIVASSLLFVYNDRCVDLRNRIQSALVADGKTVVDDYIQYLPIALNLGLSAVGVRGKNSFAYKTVVSSVSFLTMSTVVYGIKHIVAERRPDSAAKNSFPSGHTATAFLGAVLLDTEYRDEAPWLVGSCYALAATTAYMRIRNNRHYINDVVAGAAIGYISGKLGYYIVSRSPIIDKLDGNISMNILSYPYPSSYGLSFAMNVTF